MSTPKIVVTGATGTIGSRAVTLLAERRADVTAVVRDAKKARFPDNVRVVEATFEDAASLRAAFAGADTVVSLTAANANALEQANAIHEAARAAGVRKIVRISALKADPEGPTDNTRQHGRAEAALRSSGLTYVILRPHLFFQNLLGSRGSIAAERKIYFGTGSGRMGMVDTRDVSDAIVESALTDRFDGGVFELTGPASVDYHAVAAAVGRALGQAVEFVPVPPAAAGEAVRAFGADEWTVSVIRDYCTAYSSGWGDFLTDNVAKITGHEPRSADDFAREVLVPALEASVH